jgi:hypothetical protein
MARPFKSDARDAKLLMEEKILIPALPPMAAFALLVVGGFVGQVLVFALVVFFVVGGTVELLHRILELRNAWKRRVR